MLVHIKSCIQEAHYSLLPMLTGQSQGHIYINGHFSHLDHSVNGIHNYGDSTHDSTPLKVASMKPGMYYFVSTMTYQWPMYIRLSHLKGVNGMGLHSTECPSSFSFVESGWEFDWDRFFFSIPFGGILFSFSLPIRSSFFSENMSIRTFFIKFHSHFLFPLHITTWEVLGNQAFFLNPQMTVGRGLFLA